MEIWIKNKTFKKRNPTKNIIINNNYRYKTSKFIHKFFIYFTILIFIIILLFASILFTIKYYNQKNINDNSETKNNNNKIDFSKNNKYIDVSKNNLKESNTSDIV